MACPPVVFGPSSLHLVRGRTVTFAFKVLDAMGAAGITFAMEATALTPIGLSLTGTTLSGTVPAMAMLGEGKIPVTASNSEATLRYDLPYTVFVDDLLGEPAALGLLESPLDGPELGLEAAESTPLPIGKINIPATPPAFDLEVST